MKKVLLINGHPNPDSFNYALSDAYELGVKQHTTAIQRIDITKLTFDPNLKYGYHKKQELEPDLVDAISKIKEADHIVWFFPMWWYGMPAMMKGFIDRTFLPGVTFKMHEGKSFPEKLLKGKTGRIVVTADTPKWYNDWFMKNPAINQLKKGVLQFCGVKSIKVTYISVMKGSSSGFRSKWLKKLELLGKNG